MLSLQSEGDWFPMSELVNSREKVPFVRWSPWQLQTCRTSWRMTDRMYIWIPGGLTHCKQDTVIERFRTQQGGWCTAKISGLLQGHRGALQGSKKRSDWYESHVLGANVKTSFWRYSPVFLGFPYRKASGGLKSQAESRRVFSDDLD